MTDRKFGFDTLCLHAGQIPDAATGARAQPIYQTTSFVFDSRRPRGVALQPADVRQRLFAHFESHGSGSRRTRRGARRRPRGARRGHRDGCADDGAPDARPQRRPHRRRAHALRRHLFAARCHVRAVRHRRDVRRRRRSRRVRRRAEAEHQGSLCRDDRQSAAQRLRHRRACRGRARRRSSARHRQYAGVAVPVPAVRARCRHRHPFGHQIPGRSRHDNGRHRRRVREVPVGQRQLPADDRALARLPRRALLRDVRRFRLHDEGAHGDDAHARARRSRRFRHSCCCRGSRRCTCGCRGIANRRLPSPAISPRTRLSNG